MKKLLGLIILIIFLVGCGSAAELNNADIQQYQNNARHIEETEQLEQIDVNGYETEELGLTPEQMRELVESIPYPGMKTRFPWLGPVAGVPQYYFVDDDKGREIVTFLAKYITAFTGIPTTSFSSPQEIDTIFALNVSWENTYDLQWWRNSDTPGYHPELSVLAPYLVTQAYWPGMFGVRQSHIEKTAREIFSPEVVFDIPYPFVGGEMGLDMYQFLGENVFWVSFWEGHFSIVPFVLSYEYIGGGYEVKCVIIDMFGGSNVIFILGREFEAAERIELSHLVSEIESTELIDILLETENIHTIILKNNPQGSFYYWAHYLPGDR